jgi:hypothetical protein
MDRLSALSAAFLTAEDVDPDSSMVIGSIGVLSGPAPALEELWALVEQRVPPRYCQRVRRSLLGLRPPGWADEPDFDVRRRQAASFTRNSEPLGAAASRSGSDDSGAV